MKTKNKTMKTKTSKLEKILLSGKSVSEKTVKFASGSSFRKSISNLRKKGLNIPTAVNGKYSIKTKKK